MPPPLVGWYDGMKKDTDSIRWWRNTAIFGFTGWFLETAWFGFNMNPESNLERLLDSFFLGFILMGVIMNLACTVARRRMWQRFAGMAMDAMLKVGSVGTTDSEERRIDAPARIEAAACTADLLVDQYDKRFE